MDAWCPGGADPNARTGSSRRGRIRAVLGRHRPGGRRGRAVRRQHGRVVRWGDGAIEKRPPILRRCSDRHSQRQLPRTRSRVLLFARRARPATTRRPIVLRCRFQLHGGIGAREENRPVRDQGLGELRGPRDSAIHVQPTLRGSTCPWWTHGASPGSPHDSGDRQAARIRRRQPGVDLRGVRRRRRPATTVAMRDATPYASFASLIGSFMLLASRHAQPRRSLPEQPRQPAILRRQRRPRSALPRRCGGTDNQVSAEPAASRSSTWRYRMRATTPPGGPPCNQRSNDS